MVTLGQPLALLGDLGFDWQSLPILQLTSEHAQRVISLGFTPTHQIRLALLRCN